MGFWGFMIIPPVENFQENRGNGSKNHLRKFRIRNFWMISGVEAGWVIRVDILNQSGYFWFFNIIVL